jgi:dipicolinate synthase subunit A
MRWNDLVIAVVAGDNREQEIARCAVRAGAKVRCFGFPWPEAGIEGAYHAADAADALKGADVALFPIPGITPEGALFTPKLNGKIIPAREMMARMRAPAHLILGWADSNLKSICENLGIKIHEYEWDVDLMLLRGPAIVEGVLRVIIENTDITIHRSRICLVGHGTIGALLARTLVSLGAHVTVAARSPVQRAAAQATGTQSVTLEELESVLPETDILVGSVPKQIVQEKELRALPKHALLVDVAAPPGSIDHACAKALGLKMIWARGMGSRAPVTVGKSQWIGISRRIEDILKTRGNGS